MAKKKTPISVAELKCIPCGHVWLPRTPEKPLCCPKCRRADWETGKGPRSLKTVKLMLERAKV